MVHSTFKFPLQNHRVTQINSCLNGKPSDMKLAERTLLTGLGKLRKRQGNVRCRQLECKMHIILNLPCVTSHFIPSKISGVFPRVKSWVSLYLASLSTKIYKCMADRSHLMGNVTFSFQHPEVRMSSWLNTRFDHAFTHRQTRKLPSYALIAYSFVNLRHCAKRNLSRVRFGCHDNGANQLSIWPKAKPLA
jgi:hypothetical protein